MMSQKFYSASLFLFCFLRTSYLAQDSPYVRLRSATIPTNNASRSRELAARRSLGEAEYHTKSFRWGSLRDATQYIVTHSPFLEHSERVELFEKLRSVGFKLSGYIPDSSVLVVGSVTAINQVEDWPGVLWVGEYTEEYKLAPEWSAVLQQIKNLDRNISLTDFKSSAQLVASLDLPCHVDVSTGQPRIAILVSMPRDDNLLSGSGANSSSVRRAGRILAESEVQQHAGVAAAADWGAGLSALCSSGPVDIQSVGQLKALVLSPPRCLQVVLQWLSKRPAVHWIEPSPKLRLYNNKASSIVQSGQPLPSPWSPSTNADATHHPLWAAGITGAGQVIGCGDSGVDRRHCFFSDPNIDDAAWQARVSYQDRVRTFNCPECRKIRYYRAFGDDTDSNGHGSHVAGTLLGFPYSATSITSPGTEYIGMAPAAKLAFIDLGDGTSDSIYTPADLERGYFAYTTGVGAWIHSASWGSSSVNYDDLAAQVDEYSWKNKEFLAVFAAGNEGDMQTRLGDSGTSTITSPATAKNIICVGATQTQGETSALSSSYTIFEATTWEGDYSATFKVLQAGFGTGIDTLGSTEYPLVAASPLLGCAPLQNDAEVQGSVVLIQRGGCNFVEKAYAAQQAGAAAAIVFDNIMGAYFILGTDNSRSITIPTVSITRRLGQRLLDSLTVGKAVTISFASFAQPSQTFAFENLASYSSQGPTRDNRIKPDLVAPGFLQSARRLSSGFSDECETTLMAGTSMATPVVAGSATLVRQYFMDGFYPTGTKVEEDKFTPSAALIKAVMISGASSIQGVEADTGLPIDPPPSFRQGFGRVNLGRSVQLEGGSNRLQVVDDATGIKTGDAHEYCTRANGGSMYITLVWTDYPGSPAAAKALVNDLDLTVRAEGYNGRSLFGNGGSVMDSSIPDRENNVEQVYLDELPEGKVSIQVKGHSVYAAAGPQPYALVVTGSFQGSLSRSDGENGESCAIVVAVIQDGPSGVTNEDPITFSFGTQSGSSAGVAFECQLTDAEGSVNGQGLQAWEACTSPKRYSNLPDGNYDFSVRAKGERIASSQSFKLDRTAPVMSFVSTPEASSAADTAELTFSADELSTVSFSCTLTASGTSTLQSSVYSGTVNSAAVELGKPYSCTSPQTFHWLLPGQFQFVVVGTDSAGNAAVPLKHSWAVAFDPSKQYTRIFSGLFRLVPGEPAIFEFGVLKMNSGSVEQLQGVDTVCWLEDTQIGGAADWQPCSSPKSYGKLPDKTYRFHARAVASPSSSETDAVSTFTVDSTPPQSVIDKKPNAVHTSNTGEFLFSSNEEGSSFQCRLVNADDASVGNADFQDCSSPQLYYNLTDGQYEFTIKATDLVGNEGPPVSTTFAIDTTPPIWSFITYPIATQDPNITVTFSATDGLREVRNITCRFRALQLVTRTVESSQPGWNPCSSPAEFRDLEEGHYGLTLRATDQAGLVNQTEELDIWVDRTPPLVSFTSGPSKAQSSSSTATFVIDEDSALQPGTSSNITQLNTLLKSISESQYKGILNGTVTTMDPAPQDSKVLQSVGTASARGTQVTITYATDLLAESSNGSELRASDVSGSWTAAQSPLTYTGLGNGFYALQVRAVDMAGNEGNNSTPYAFQVEESSSTNTVIWIIVGAAGGAALLVAVVFLLIWARRRKRPAAQAAGPVPPRPVAPVTNGHSNGHHNGYHYPSNSAAGYGSAGAWGYPPTPGYSGGVPVDDPIYQQQLALDASRRQAPHFDQGMYEQQLSYALAASQQPVVPPGYPPAHTDDDEMQRAIQASLQEQRSPAHPSEDDPEMKAAIQASLQEQQRYVELSPWTGSPGSQARNTNSNPAAWDRLI